MKSKLESSNNEGVIFRWWWSTTITTERAKMLLQLNSKHQIRSTWINCKYLVHCCWALSIGSFDSCVFLTWHFRSKFLLYPVICMTWRVLWQTPTWIIPPFHINIEVYWATFTGVTRLLMHLAIFWYHSEVRTCSRISAVFNHLKWFTSIQNMSMLPFKSLLHRKSLHWYLVLLSI